MLDWRDTVSAGQTLRSPYERDIAGRGRLKKENFNDRDEKFLEGRRRDDRQVVL